MAQAKANPSTTKRGRLQAKALALAEKAQRPDDPIVQRILEDEALRIWQSAHGVYEAAAAQVLAELDEGLR